MKVQKQIHNIDAVKLLEIRNIFYNLKRKGYKVDNLTEIMSQAMNLGLDEVIKIYGGIINDKENQPAYAENKDRR
jgi:hypothetical protein